MQYRENGLRHCRERIRMILVIGGAFQGKTAYVQNRFGDTVTVINNYQERIRSQLQEGLEPLAEAEELLRERQGQQLVLISDEVGYGLVPVDAFERKWREAVGRVNCYLAQRAEEVVRVVCGIETRIK